MTRRASHAKARMGQIQATGTAEWSPVGTRLAYLKKRNEAMALVL